MYIISVNIQVLCAESGSDRIRLKTTLKNGAL